MLTIIAECPGDVKGYKIDYTIDLQTDGGAYQTVLTTKIQDKTSAGYERTHRIDLPKAKTGWQLRVRRIMPFFILGQIVIGIDGGRIGARRGTKQQ